LQLQLNSLYQSQSNSSSQITLPLSAEHVSCLDVDEQITDLQSQLNSIYYAQSAESNNVVGGTGIKIEKKYTISPATVPISTEMMDVAYGNNVFVAVGRLGRILSSQDDKIWVEQASNINKVLNRVSYGNELFVVIGEYGTILTSPDGRTWTNQTFSETYD
jgi:hypothetical protein